ncbi:CCR4-NOT transcription complex subunit 1 [Impatiens glandulifera]|uniref:CCR4-NOT transcription complex subunit 1 n=1 Tax=Impatiens glandulifera TaxID=253017 RepID=UPI001FB07119|nr:CCR4-NOT transcription complex subunit 1 [Impatiens glandulifera]
MPGLPPALAGQIRYLLLSLNGSNSDAVFQDLLQYVEYGTEGGVLVLMSFLQYLNIYEKVLKKEPLDPVFCSIFKHILDKPNFSTILCTSLRGEVINEDFLENLTKAIGLSTSEKIGVGLALSDSGNLDHRLSGNNLCIAQIGELCAENMSLGSAEQIQSIFMFLQRSEGLSKHLDSFMQLLSLMQFKEDDQFILTPLMPRELPKGKFSRNLDLFDEDHENDFDTLLAEMEKEMSMSDIMKELGYGCTVSVSQCKEMLSLFLPLTEVTVSRILGTIICTNTGLDDHQNTFPTFCSALGSTTSSDQTVLNSWNIDVLIDSIQQLAPRISWSAVIENLDHEGFCIPNETAFSFFMSIYRRACQDPFPLHAICGSLWRNTEGQLSFLKYAVVSPHELFTFAHSGRQLAYADAFQGHKLPLGPTNHAWICLDLLQTLCQLAEVGHANAVRSILKFPLEQCPEVLLLGMAHINTTYNLIQHEVSSAVLPVILNHSAGVGMVFHLWHVNPSTLLRGFVDVYSINPDNMSRIFDICQELKIISLVLDMVPFSFGIRLAALASRKDLLDMEKWIKSNVTTYTDPLFEECIRFIKEQFSSYQDVSAGNPHQSVSLSNLYSEAASTIFKVLQDQVPLNGTDLLTEEIEMWLTSSTHSSSRLKNSAPSDFSTADGFADDIEIEANSYFHQMFSGQLTIEAMIQMLARFKESSEKREQSIFDCMIGNLFEEYKFFPKYPDRQLKIAAVLFGSLIKHQLVSHLTLGIALRAVLDALRKPGESKMCIFGTKALEQFVDRLIEWPQYCNHILQISHLRASHSELVAFIERALARISSGNADSGGVNASDQHGSFHSTAATAEMPSSSFRLIGSASTQSSLQISSALQLQQRDIIPLEESQKLSLASSNFKSLIPPPGQPSPLPPSDATTQKNTTTAATIVPSSVGFTRPSRAIASARFGSALNIETLVAAAERRETPLEAPASEVQDKISFIINNLSVANFESKAKEFTEFLKDQYYPWFAQYMVMKRASIEPNFHDLYLKFLEKVSSPSLNKEILQATYENCKVLLGSELIKSSSEERSLLKNLGSWLGKFTIGRNKALRACHIDPKSLIIEAYEKGLMIAVIPFTSKVLEPCQNSAAYQPPNPYTMGILKLLAEIYAMPNLKMNLKFDIEVLFKNLSVDLKGVTPTSLLKDIVRQIEGNPDFSTKDVVAPPQSIVSEVKSNAVSALNQVELPLEVATPAHPGGHSHMLSQFAAPPLHLTAGALIEDEKMAALGLSDQLSSAQGLVPRQSSFSVNQLSTPASNIEQQVIVNPKLHTLGLYLHFQSVVPLAMDRAIKEIVSGIVQRSVSIATQTTKELVLKDYAMEYDENRIRSAAHLMVASLAGSLAHVTCKEPLRGSISSQLRSTLQGSSIGNELLEQAVQLVTNDNLDLGCALIEQAATEKAIQTIDGEIAQQLSIRRKHRDGVGPAFYDSGLYTQGHTGGLPEALRPKPGRLSHSQQRVYEDFVKLPWQNQSSHNSNTLPVGSSAPSSSASMSKLYSSVSGQLNPGIYSSGLGNSGVSSLVQPLDITSEEMDSSAVQLHSVANIVSTDGVNQSDFDGDSVVASFPSASAAELHPIEPPIIAKDSGAPLQILSSTTASDRVVSSSSEQLLTTGDALEKYQIISEKLEDMVANDATEAETQGIIGEVPGIILRCVSRDEAALAVAQKVFKGLYENASNSAHVAAHLAILAAIRDVSKLVVKELTSWVIYSDEDRKLNKDITVGLIRSELLNLAEYNLHMAKLLDAGRNKAATEFAISLIQTLVHSDPRIISELHNLVDALAKLAARPGSPESLQQLVEVARNPSPNAPAISAFGKEDNGRQMPRDKKALVHIVANREDYSVTELSEPDPAGFRDQASMFFAEWYKICELPVVNDAVSSHYVLQLHQSGLLKGDDMSDRFFRCLTEISVSHCLSSSETMSSAPLQSQQVQPLSFLAIDIYAKLVFSILKFCPVDQGSNNKLYLLPKILLVTVRIIHKDAEEKKSSFNPRPYFRLFINWLLDLSSMEPVFDGANLQVLTAFANTFHALQPLKVPGFSFAWLELISQRSFLPKLLTGNSQKGWPYMQRLLVDLFQFLEPFLRTAELGDPVHVLYKGTLRVLLVLLHDYPEFLCDYHFSFCDVIPSSCIQMRNIILSAFPRNMRLPDPSTPNLKIDLLAEISQSPRILSEVDAALKAKQMKSEVDEYLKIRQQGSTFLSDLKQKLLLPPNEALRSGTRYNIPLINSLVLYVGMQAIQQLQARTPPHTQAIPSSAPLAVFLVGAALDIFQMLMMDLDTEGRYLFLNVVANQLRYPNNHTHYFSFILLYLFNESNQEIIQEQITRVLLERLIVNRPHPWGLLITFIELIKNPRYNFWSKSFTRCAPEIEKLFESVSRSCGGPKPVDDSLVASGISDPMH